MAVVFHIVADSMLVAADGVPGFFPGVAFKNQLDCQETLVQPAVVCRIHRFFQFTDFTVSQQVIEFLLPDLLFFIKYFCSQFYINA